MKYRCVVASSLSLLLLQLLLIAAPSHAWSHNHDDVAVAAAESGAVASHNSRRYLRPPPPAKPAGGSGGGSSSSSSSSGGSSSSGSSSSAAASSKTTSMKSSSSNNPLKTFLDRLRNSLLYQAIIAAAVLAGVLALIFFVVRSKRKKKKPALKLEENLLSSAATSDSGDSVEIIPPFTGPTSGLYKSADTELRISFGAANDLGYGFTGSGYQKCDEDSHMDAIAIEITKGYASLDGSKSWWIEERKPFFDTRQPKKTSGCPRPKCNTNNCRANTGVIPRTFSVDGESVHTVKCKGSFDYSNNTFEGSWCRIQKNNIGGSRDLEDSLLPQQGEEQGTYMLALQREESPQASALQGIDEEEGETSLSPRKRLMKNVWSLFGRKR